MIFPKGAPMPFMPRSRVAGFLLALLLIGGAPLLLLQAGESAPPVIRHSRDRPDRAPLERQPPPPRVSQPPPDDARTERLIAKDRAERTRMNDAQAQYDLALRYLREDGVERNPREAERLLRAAAAQGHPEAHKHIGWALAQSGDVLRDTPTLLAWLRRRAAEDNDGWSMDILGRMYEGGEGVPTNQAEALKWFRGAADQGFAYSQFRLGIAAETGKGVAVNHADATHWFTLAGAQGHMLSQHNAGLAYEKGKGVPANPAEAFRWYLLAAEQGFVDSQLNVGVAYHQGRGVRADFREAERWYLAAAGQDSAAAMNNLGVLYDAAKPRRAADSARWFLAAAERGHARAQLHIGIAYANGDGVEKNLREAERWVETAVRQNEPDSHKVLREVREAMRSAPPPRPPPHRHGGRR